MESRNFFFYTHDIVLSDVYLVWPSNKTTPDFEIMFKALTDDGKTFEPKINPSNSTGIDSERPEIAAFGNNVYVTWWERNQTSNEPVLGVSNDSGKTFGEKICYQLNNRTPRLVQLHLFLSPKSRYLSLQDEIP